MTETPPIQCSCGVTAFADIRVNTAGVMSMTCFHCRQVTHYSVPIAMAEQAWIATEREAPEPTLPDRASYELCEKAQEIMEQTFERWEREASEPESVKPSGYRYGGML